MTRVLSIDLDYITNHYAELIRQMFYMNSSYRWSKFMREMPFDRSHFYIDQSNLMFCFNTFLKALRNKPKVYFGYDHDSILFAIDKEDNIDLINIDHHDDIFEGFGKSPQDEYDAVTKHNLINQGNWGLWLHTVSKLKSFTWIKNDNSDLTETRELRGKDYLGDLYKSFLKEEYTFENYNFDCIFVCLSPQYIFPDHWHYFSMFISVYEEIYEKDAVIFTEKYETHVRHKDVHKQILDQCSKKMTFESLRKNSNN